MPGLSHFWGLLGIGLVAACDGANHGDLFSGATDAAAGKAGTTGVGGGTTNVGIAAASASGVGGVTTSGGSASTNGDASGRAGKGGEAMGGAAGADVAGAGAGGGAACAYSAPNGVSLAPPYTGADDLDPAEGQGLIRTGPLARFAGLVYPDDALAKFRVARGFVDPACQPGLLSNPYRDDGTALNAGYAIPAGFTGHVPVFTEGNWWPFVGPNQPQPPHGNLRADAGIYLVNAELTVTARPLLVMGETGATITNRTPYGILVSSGSYPGDEQPGQVMTPITSGQTVPMPIPPRGWYPDANGNPRVPELYISVAGLDPIDAVGWHVSNTVPDYGTPGFAYTFGGKYTTLTGQAQAYLFVGFNRNEGYDPILSADPGYGVEVYMTPEGAPRTLIAITDITSLGSRSARQDLWAAPQFNPQVNVQGGLSAFPNGPEGTQFSFELVPHDVAQLALQAQAGAVLHSTDTL